VRFHQVVKLTTDVRHAWSLLNQAVFIKLVESSVM
jgi:hypothetical protein